MNRRWSTWVYSAANISNRSFRSIQAWRRWLWFWRNSWVWKTWINHFLADWAHIVWYRWFWLSSNWKNMANISKEAAHQRQRASEWSSSTSSGNMDSLLHPWKKQLLRIVKSWTAWTCIIFCTAKTVILINILRKMEKWLTKIFAHALCRLLSPRRWIRAIPRQKIHKLN